MDKLPVSTKTVSEEFSKKDALLYQVIVDSMTRISAHLRQEVNRIDWESMFYALINAGLSNKDCGRVKEAFDRCMREVDFIPNSKAVLARLPESVTENQKPDLEFIRDYYQPYSATLREHVFEYKGGYRQVKLEKIA